MFLKCLATFFFFSTLGGYTNIFGRKFPKKFFFFFFSIFGLKRSDSTRKVDCANKKSTSHVLEKKNFKRGPLKSIFLKIFFFYFFIKWIVSHQKEHTIFRAKRVLKNDTRPLGRRVVVRLTSKKERGR